MPAQALVIVDAQNEFSPAGRRAVPNHAAALDAIARWVAYARAQGWPIAWVRHHNKPHESPAFIPGTWGAEISPELDPRLDSVDERLFEKDVFGAFTGTALEGWLRGRGVSELVIAGFYAHMCVSTSTREALVRDFAVAIDPAATGATAVRHAVLGEQSAEEVRRSALLQLTHMGATIATTPAAVVAEEIHTGDRAPALRSR